MDIRNYDGGKLLAGTSGADAITNYGANVTVDAGDGNDTVQNGNYPLAYAYGTNVIIDAGAGNDSIYNDTCANVSIEAGEGDDTIENSGTEALIRMGAGNDFITNGGGNVSIYAGTGNDTIRNYASNALINGGAGDDFISLPSYSQSNVIEYAAGDGNDTIFGINESDTLTITGGSYYSLQSGNDIIVIVGNGSMILTGAADLSELNINGKSAPLISWNLDGSTATYGSLVITGVTSLDGIYLIGKVVTVSAASLGTGKVSITGEGYKLALGSDVSSSTTKKSWSLSGTTATYKQTTKAGYTLADNAKSITYSKKSVTTLVKVKGVTSLDGLKLSGTTVTVSAASLGTNDVTISDGYALALGSDVESSSSKKSWSAAVTFVRAKSIYRRVCTRSNHCRPYSHCCVNQIRLMNDHTQKTTQGICCYLPLSTFCFFPPSKPRWSPA